MSDLSEIMKAIEASNKQFEDFKTANEAKLEALKKGQSGADEVARMQAIFADFSTQQKAVKELVETMEAKSRRLHIGEDGKAVDPAQEEHRTAFKGYMSKGRVYDEGAMQYANGMTVKSLAGNSGPDGGFAVPKVIDGLIDSIAVNISPIRSLASVIQVSTPDYHKLINARGSSSGWVGEAAARTSTNTSTLIDIQPPMGELYANPQATQQMLDDVFFNAEQWLADELATEFARAEGAAFITGTGVNQPKGFLSGTSAATADATRTFGVIEHVATAANGALPTLSSTVNPCDTLFSVVSKMKAAYRTGASWVMNKKTLFYVAAQKDYQGRYVFSPTTAPGVADTILGYPVTEAEDMPDYTTTDALAIAFGNWKRCYLIVDRIGTRVIRDPFSNKPYIGFYTTRRVGGALTNSEALKVIKFGS